VTPAVVEAELKVSKTVDRRLSRNSADDGANPVFQRNVLVAGTLRNRFEHSKPSVLNSLVMIDSYAYVDGERTR
jgi:hypothetical protein